MAKEFAVKNRSSGGSAGSTSETGDMGKAAIQDSAIFGNDLIATKVMNIDVSIIEPNPFQPRLELDDTTQAELMASIETRGLLQPIVIQKKPEGKGYVLVSGQRRLDAHKRLGKEVIPAIITEGDNSDLLVNALVENIQRENLNPLEIAISIERLKSEKARLKEKITYDEIAALIGKDKAAVSKLMSLLKLDVKVQEHVAKGSYKVLQVLHLLNSVVLDRQFEVLQHIISNKLNREDAVAYIGSLVQKPLKSTQPAFVFNADDKKGKYTISLSVANMSKADKEDAIVELEALIVKLRGDK